MFSILIVCTGNTCRSPMAEYLLRELLKKQSAGESFTVQSAGLACYPGDPISENARLVLAERSIDASGHLSRPVSAQAVLSADRIYVMTEAHRQAIAEALPEAADRLYVLGVSDPYGMPVEAYRACAEQIEAYFVSELPQLLSAAAEKEKAQE